MAGASAHVLTVDLGGTHTTVAVFACYGDERCERVQKKSYASREIVDFPGLLRQFLDEEIAGLQPEVTRACIDYAGPVDPERKKASITNLDWGFTVDDVRSRTGLDEVSLINDFEAVGYGVEALRLNQPEAFVRLSASGELPPHRGNKPTAVIIGAGTGLGTGILVQNARTGRYQPIAGEGGHADFCAVEKDEFEIAQWIRRHKNHSPLNPIDREKIVSGPGISNIYEALWSIQPGNGSRSLHEQVAGTETSERPAIIAGNAGRDDLCRRTMDLWVRCYARAAKNSALFPLAPGGVFLAGGVTAKVLPELKSGGFMEQFTRCDVPGIRAILKRTPVFAITQYEIGLFGCATVAMNPTLLS